MAMPYTRFRAWHEHAGRVAVERRNRAERSAWEERQAEERRRLLGT